MKIKHKLFIILFILIFFIWFTNSSLMSRPPFDSASFLAHRGVAQTFPKTNLNNDTCTASIIYQPKHKFLENTLKSMEYAFKLGANIVEFDIHITKDKQLAVFHDWRLECRTNGIGITHSKTMAYLKSLDIGYGYTSDGGKSYPFRGQFIGKMPEIDEVFATFPKRQFLINIKSNRLDEVQLLIKKIEALPKLQQSRLMIYGGSEKQYSQLRRNFPYMPITNKARLRACIIDYMSKAWSGFTPKACENNILLIPKNLRYLIWGWPNKFLYRMKKANTRVFVVNDFNRNQFLTGFSVNDINGLLRNEQYTGGIWLDDMDLLTIKRNRLNSNYHILVRQRSH